MTVTLPALTPDEKLVGLTLATWMDSDGLVKPDLTFDDLERATGFDRQTVFGALAPLVDLGYLAVEDGHRVLARIPGEDDR
jgi:hypothetical protein